MLKIRFLRTGKQHQPYFKIVVTDKDNPPRGGNFKAEVGNYNPRSKEAQLDREEIEHWLDEGAKPSGRVHNLLVEEGILDEEKEAVHAQGQKQSPSATDEASRPPQAAEEDDSEGAEEEAEESPESEEKDKEGESEDEESSKEAEKEEEEPSEEKKKEQEETEETKEEKEEQDEEKEE